MSCVSLQIIVIPLVTIFYQFRITNTMNCEVHYEFFYCYIVEGAYLKYPRCFPSCFCFCLVCVYAHVGAVNICAAANLLNF